MFIRHFGIERQIFDLQVYIATELSFNIKYDDVVIFINENLYIKCNSNLRNYIQHLPQHSHMLPLNSKSIKLLGQSNKQN